VRLHPTDSGGRPKRPYVHAEFPGQRGDAEEIVCKFARGGYSVDPAVTSWAEVLNAEYAQAEGRHELFERRFAGKPRRIKPQLVIPMAAGGYD
jgi:hypothetical protein